MTDLLFVSHCPPWPLDSGNTQRVYHLLRGLAARRRVTLATLSSGADAEAGARSPAREWCDRIVEVDFRTCRWGPGNQAERFRRLFLSPLPHLAQAWHSDAFVDALRALRRERRFDAVWVERWYTAEMVAAAGFGDMVVDLDDIQTIAKRRDLRHVPFRASTPLHWLELAKLSRYEHTLPRRFRRLVVCKEEDRRFFGRWADRVAVVPNGTERHPPAAPERVRPGEMLFLGPLGYGPNVDAVRFFHAEILPAIRSACPNARLVVVGRGTGERLRDLDDGSACTVVGPVPDVTPYFEAAALVVVPMRLGSGTRLKVLEALGRGKAVVSTSVGAEGLELRPGIDLALADTPAAFAEACIKLLADGGARRTLGEAGRARVLERYDWDVVIRAAEEALLG